MHYFPPPLPLPHPLHNQIHSSPPLNRLQRTNLKRSRASSNGVVGDGGVAAGQDNVALAGDGCGAVRCGRDGQGEASVDCRCAAGGKKNQIPGGDE